MTLTPTANHAAAHVSRAGDDQHEHEGHAAGVADAVVGLRALRPLGGRRVLPEQAGAVPVEPLLVGLRRGGLVLEPALLVRDLEDRARAAGARGAEVAALCLVLRRSFLVGGAGLCYPVPGRNRSSQPGGSSA